MSKEIQIAATKYTDIAEFVKTLNDNELPQTPCKLCNSKLKKEAEEMYERQGNISSVTRFLKEKGEDISNTAVTNHLNNHFNNIQRNADLREYANELSKWSKLSKGDESIYNRYIDSLDREYNLLMAEIPRFKDSSERRKNIEIALKIAQQVGYYKEQLHKLDLEKRPVEIMVDELNRIVKVKLQDIKNPEVKRVLEDVVIELVKKVDQVPDEG